MKKIYTLVLMSLAVGEVFGQSGTIYLGSDCDPRLDAEYYSFSLRDNTLYSRGNARNICCGDNYFTYTVIGNEVRIKKKHEGLFYYNLCLYPFSFTIEECYLPSYRIIVEGTNIDTTVCNQNTTLQLADKRQKPSVNVFPNPAKNKITVNMTGLWKGYSTFEIYNIIGQKVFTKENISETFDVEIRNISKGAYFYKMIGNDGVVLTGKLLFE